MDTYRNINTCVKDNVERDRAREMLIEDKKVMECDNREKRAWLKQYE